MSDLFFTADEHLGHANIIKYCKRPFSSLEEMTEIIVERHNKKVPRGGRVVHVGDMFWRTFGAENAGKVLDRLNGQHHYVWGNHEELLESNPDVLYRFRSIGDRYRLSVPGYPQIICDHYAGRVWRNSHRGSWQLYGHSHGELPEVGALAFDVGVDCWNFEPVSIEEVAAKMKRIGESKITAVGGTPNPCSAGSIPVSPASVFEPGRYGVLCAHCDAHLESHIGPDSRCP